MLIITYYFKPIIFIFIVFHETFLLIYFHSSLSSCFINTFENLFQMFFLIFLLSSFEQAPLSIGNVLIKCYRGKRCFWKLSHISVHRHILRNNSLKEIQCMCLLVIFMIILQTHLNFSNFFCNCLKSNWNSQPFKICLIALAIYNMAKNVIELMINCGTSSQKSTRSLQMNS